MISEAEFQRLRDDVQGLLGRVEVIEDEHDALLGLPSSVSNLAGKVDTLQLVVLAKIESVGEGVDKVAGFKTAIQFAAVVVVPVLVALIGGYFALRIGLASTK